MLFRVHTEYTLQQCMLKINVNFGQSVDNLYSKDPDTQVQELSLLMGFEHVHMKHKETWKIHKRISELRIEQQGRKTEQLMLLQQHGSVIHKDSPPTPRQKAQDVKSMDNWKMKQTDQVLQCHIRLRWIVGLVEVTSGIQVAVCDRLVQSGVNVATGSLH